MINDDEIMKYLFAGSLAALAIILSILNFQASLPSPQSQPQPCVVSIGNIITVIRNGISQNIQKADCDRANIISLAEVLLFSVVGFSFLYLISMDSFWKNIFSSISKISFAIALLSFLYVRHTTLHNFFPLIVIVFLGFTFVFAYRAFFSKRKSSARKPE